MQQKGSLVERWEGSEAVANKIKLIENTIDWIDAEVSGIIAKAEPICELEDLSRENLANLKLYRSQLNELNNRLEREEAELKKILEDSR